MAELILLNKIRVDIGNVSGPITELLQYAFLKGFNDNYEPQDKPRLVGTWTINDWYTTAQLAEAQAAFDGLTIVASPAYLIDFSQLAVQTLDSTKPGYNPGFAIKLHNKGYGVCLDNAPVPGQKGRYFLTKSQAGNINASDIGSTSKTLSDSNLIVSDTVASYTISTLKELQYFSVTNWSSALFTAWSWPSIMWVPESITNFGFYCLQHSNNVVLRCLKTTPPAIDDWYSYMANGLEHLCVGLGLDEYQDAGIVEAYQNFNATSSARYNYSNKKLKSWFEYAAPKVSYDGTDVTMTVERASDIYYTTDGSTPTKSSTKYTAPFAWNGVGVIKAVGVETLNNSEDYVYRDFYAQTTADPVIAISGSTIEITAEQGATIYYTTDGSYPNIQSTVYTGPLDYSMNIANKIRCFAQVQGSKNASDVVELNVADTVALQTVNPQGEKYNPAVSIKMEQAGYGNYIDVNDKTKGWYLTKADAALITSLPSFRNFVTIVDVNGICGVVGSTYTFETFDELDYFTGITTIGYQTFSNCTSLTSITIPSSVTVIRWQAFVNCTSLSTIYMNAEITKYSNDTPFSNIGSTNLSVIIGNNVTTINAYTFQDCTSMTSVSISNSVTSIGQWAFSGCSSLTSVIIPDSVTLIGSQAFNSCTSLTSVSISDSVTEIGGQAFSNCTSLTSITIPSSVTVIRWQAFVNCTSLSTIYLNAELNRQSNDAIFGGIGSSNLSVIIGNNVTKINAFTFYLSSMTSVSIPNSVTIIENYAFVQCPSLTSVIIPNSVTSIGPNAFQGCSSLTSVTLSESMTTINWLVFSGCTSLTTVTIPSSITIISWQAFINCTSLPSITIPNAVTEIGNSTFAGCTSLNTIISESTTPPSLSSSALDNVPADATIYVPSESVATYKSAANWSARAAYIQAIPTT